MEYKVGDKVFLRVSPWKEVMRFRRKGKLSPRYIGPYDIIEIVGPLSYKLALPPELEQIHNVFHFSMLRRYRSDPSHVLRDPDIQISENLSYIDEPINIVDRRVKQLRRKEIPKVKVIWQNHRVEEATWETEEKMRKNYPHLFTESRCEQRPLKLRFGAVILDAISELSLRGSSLASYLGDSTFMWTDSASFNLLKKSCEIGS
ncbi:uncharacterized protein LOC121804063 [Salvia splendens]|uniref:uncharacterized protein LOC121804063 n=1 Tax=Salvia splendens TaxID=180675 RepID=UPI001C2594ED|nr:uncharacterized protein LOC121804063 [Salvia splendens]